MAENILEAPRYSAAEAARFIGVTPNRARRWWRGYTFDYDLTNGTARHGESHSVVRAGNTRQQHYMSFLDLMDLLLVKRMRDHGVSLQRLRRAFQQLRTSTRGTHPSRYTFFVWAQSVFWDHTPSDPMLLQLDAGGQTAFRDVVGAVGVEIDVEATLRHPLRWYPSGRDGGVVIDPAVVFGQPHLVGHRITTEALYDLYQAEHGNARAVAGWYSIRPKEVAAAVRYHTTLVA